MSGAAESCRARCPLPQTGRPTGATRTPPPALRVRPVNTSSWRCRVALLSPLLCAGVRQIVTLECTEARAEGATPSRYTTQKVRCGGTTEGSCSLPACPA